MNNKTVDIIIPTYRPDAEFNKLLQKLGDQTVKPNKIILVNSDDGESSLDKLKITLNELCEVINIDKKDFNHGDSRNTGVKRSKADYFICMTQDAIPKDEQLVEKLISSLNDQVKIAYAKQEAKSNAKEIEKITREFNYPDKSVVKTKTDLSTLGIKTFFASNVCCAYDRKTFDELGGFIATDFNEDMMYAAKLIDSGYSIMYNADAIVYHSHNYTSKQQYDRNVCLAKSQVLHPEYFGKVKSESEGIKLVTKTAKELTRRKKAYLIPELIWISGVKYLGYKRGRKQ